MRTIYKQIEDYLTYCEKVRRMSAVTLRTKRYILLRFAEITKLRDLKKLSNSAFDAYVSELLTTGISGRSANTYNATVVAFVRYYQGMGLTIPFKIVLAQKLKEAKIERKFYTMEEIEKVVALASPEVELMIRIMFETGMRITELTQLKTTDFCGRQIQFIGKGQKKREVYVTESTLELIRMHTCKNDVNGFLWGTTLNGEPPTTNTIRSKLKTAFSRAGFADFYPHALRHSFATNLQVNGASVAEIKEMMGHSSIATTEKYLHGFSGRLAELFEKYSFIL